MQYHMGMRYIIASVSLILGLLLVALGISVARADDSAKTTVKKVPVHETTAMNGQELFRQYCAVCHGPGGKGNGPAAAALKTPPADLTQIAAHNGGKFPEVKVQGIINGDAEAVAAHGSKDMPMWGDIFRHMGHNDEIGVVRVHNLEKYLEGLQAK
jgi:mono/diheme cytochrome c family protein